MSRGRIVEDGLCEPSARMKAQNRADAIRQNKAWRECDYYNVTAICARDSYTDEIRKAIPEFERSPVRPCPTCAVKLCEACWYAHPGKHFPPDDDLSLWSAREDAKTIEWRNGTFTDEDKPLNPFAHFKWMHDQHIKDPHPWMFGFDERFMRRTVLPMTAEEYVQYLGPL